MIHRHAYIYLHIKKKKRLGHDVQGVHAPLVDKESLAQSVNS